MNSCLMAKPCSSPTLSNDFPSSDKVAREIAIVYRTCSKSGDLSQLGWGYDEDFHSQSQAALDYSQRRDNYSHKCGIPPVKAQISRGHIVIPNMTEMWSNRS